MNLHSFSIVGMDDPSVKEMTLVLLRGMGRYSSVIIAYPVEEKEVDNS